MGVTMLENERHGSFTEIIAHKWRMFRLVQQTNGFFTALCEVFYQCCKPMVYAYTKFSWWWYRTHGRTTINILGNQLSLHPRDKGVSIELAVYRVHEDPDPDRLVSVQDDLPGAGSYVPCNSTSAVRTSVTVAGPFSAKYRSTAPVARSSHALPSGATPAF